MYTVDTDSSTAQGDVYNSTAVTIDFGTSDIGFNIQVMEIFRRRVLTSGSARNFKHNKLNAEQPFGSQSLKQNLTP